MRKVRIYLYCSWVATLLGMIFLRGGFHPGEAAADLLRWYGRALVVILHAMMLFTYFFLEERPKRVLVALLVVAVSLMCCYGLLG